MYTYIIRTHDPESSMQIELLNEKEFTEEEFDEMAAECFALAIKKDWNESDDTSCIAVDDYIHSCADIMVEKYKFVKSQNATQVFEVYWIIERKAPTPNGKLIFKHLDGIF